MINFQIQSWERAKHRAAAATARARGPLFDSSSRAASSARPARAIQGIIRARSARSRCSRFNR